MEAEKTTDTTRRNGLDLAVLQGAIDELGDYPKAATVTIRTRHRWDDGFAVDGYADESEEAGEVSPDFHLPYRLSGAASCGFAVGNC
jgi:hypothetical protein